MEMLWIFAQNALSLPNFAGKWPGAEIFKLMG